MANDDLTYGCERRKTLQRARMWEVDQQTDWLVMQPLARHANFEIISCREILRSRALEARGEREC